MLRFLTTLILTIFWLSLLAQSKVISKTQQNFDFELGEWENIRKELFSYDKNTGQLIEHTVLKWEKHPYYWRVKVWQFDYSWTYEYTSFGALASEIYSEAHNVVNERRTKITTVYDYDAHKNLIMKKIHTGEGIDFFCHEKWEYIYQNANQLQTFKHYQWESGGGNNNGNGLVQQIDYIYSNADCPDLVYIKDYSYMNKLRNTVKEMEYNENCLLQIEHISQDQSFGNDMFQRESRNEYFRIIDNLGRTDSLVHYENGGNDNWYLDNGYVEHFDNKDSLIAITNYRGSSGELHLSDDNTTYEFLYDENNFLIEKNIRSLNSEWQTHAFVKQQFHNYCDGLPWLKTIRDGISFNSFYQRTLFEYDKPTTCEELNAEQISIKIYPNPTINYLYIESSLLITGNPLVSIYDSKGSIIFRDDNPPRSMKLEYNLTNIPDGLYFLHITNGEEKQVENFLLNK